MPKKIDKVEEEIKNKKLIAQWLSKNKPTVIKEPEVEDYLVGQTTYQINIKGY